MEVKLFSSTSEFVETVTTRHNHGIDPTLHIWGWEIPVYLFLGGLAAGLLVLPALLSMKRKPGDPPALPASVRHMPLLGLVLISLGMVALFLDLEFKSHVFRFYMSFEPASPMSWGSWILLLVYPAGLLLWISLLDGGDRRRLLPGSLGETIGSWCDNRRGFVLGASITSGVALGTYTGLLLGTLGARPMWNSTLLGPLFLISGLSTAAALMLLFRPAGETGHRLVRWDMGLIVAELVFIGLFIMTLMTGSRVTQEAGRELLGGRWTGVFWSLVVILGLVVPFVLELVETKKHAKPAIMTSVLILIGGLSLRWILLAAGQASSFGSLH
jgi:formate-dependent nitrite reductase membrane component NrfD